MLMYGFVSACVYVGVSLSVQTIYCTGQGMILCVCISVFLWKCVSLSVQTIALIRVWGVFSVSIVVKVILPEYVSLSKETKKLQQQQQQHSVIVSSSYNLTGVFKSTDEENGKYFVMSMLVFSPIHCLE